jgi:hypothetical protein
VLQNKIKNIKTPGKLKELKDIRYGLIAAAGISEKAEKHLGIDGCNEAIDEFIKNFLIPSGEKFKEELVFRFLLTRGDSLGGSMRNIVGSLAQKKLNLSIIASLRLSGKSFYWLHESSKQWIFSEIKSNDIDLENAKGLCWMINKRDHRCLYYNITVPIIKNNIDMILLKNSKDESLKEIIINPSNYIALGELKGGIDPAGADEHWKTAKTAIDRITGSFKKHKKTPSIFYIGAAIENKMALEIFANLKSGYIKNSANLTKPDQITSLVEWLLEL